MPERPRPWRRTRASFFSDRWWLVNISRQSRSAGLYLDEIRSTTSLSTRPTDRRLPSSVDGVFAYEVIAESTAPKSVFSDAVCSRSCFGIAVAGSRDSRRRRKPPAARPPHLYQSLCGRPLQRSPPSRQRTAGQTCATIQEACRASSATRFVRRHHCCR